MAQQSSSNATPGFAIISVLIGLVNLVSADWWDALIWLALGVGLWLTRNLNLTMREQLKHPQYLIGFVLGIMALVAALTRIVLDLMT